MKKKILLSLTLITFLIIGTILILERNNTISIIKSIKNTIHKQSQIEENEEITIVDITNLETGSDINHQHIFKTNYNSTEHWNECTICHEKIDIVNHNFITTWALGYELCGWNNPYTKTCSCGYKETGHKPCVWDGRTYESHAGFFRFENNLFTTDEYSLTHARQCSICKQHIYESYYMNQYGNGTLYKVTTGKKRKLCGVLYKNRWNEDYL